MRVHGRASERRRPMKFPVEIHTAIGRQNRIGRRAKRRRVLHALEDREVEGAHAAGTNDSHLRDAPVAREDDLETRDELHVVERVIRRERIERAELRVGEERVNADVHRVQVAGERNG
jgi:hypothetical protein